MKIYVLTSSYGTARRVLGVTNRMEKARKMRDIFGLRIESFDTADVEKFMDHKNTETYYTFVFDGDDVDSVTAFDPSVDRLPENPGNTVDYDEITGECYVNCYAEDLLKAGEIASDLRRAYLEGTLKNED